MQGDLNEELEMQGDRHEELGRVPGAAADPKPVRVRGHGGKPFSAAEEDELRRGVRLHGNGAWATILRTGSFAAHRTNVDLKDKWRNMARAAEPRSTGTPPPLGGGSEAGEWSERLLALNSAAGGEACSVRRRHAAAACDTRYTREDTCSVGRSSRRKKRRVDNMPSSSST